MCCGKRRNELKANQAAKLPPSKTFQAVRELRKERGLFSSASHSDGATVSVRYTESQSVVVRGPVTGLRYAFSSADPVQTVDQRDAAALLQARFFRRA
jgi:hypothetical protein